MFYIAIALLGIGFLIIFLGTMSLQSWSSHERDGYKKNPNDDSYVIEHRYRHLHVRTIVAGGGIFVLGAIIMTFAVS